MVVRGCERTFAPSHRTLARSHRTLAPSQRRPVMRVEDAGAGYLRQRVNPGVGAAGTMHEHLGAVDLRQRRFQQPLHRNAAFLPLPPDELGPIVRDS